jgi:hypothetical protein
MNFGLKPKAIDAKPASCTNFLLDGFKGIMDDCTTKYNLFCIEQTDN